MRSGSVGLIDFNPYSLKCGRETRDCYERSTSPYIVSAQLFEVLEKSGAKGPCVVKGFGFQGDNAVGQQ